MLYENAHENIPHTKLVTTCVVLDIDYKFYIYYFRVFYLYSLLLLDLLILLQVQNDRHHGVPAAPGTGIELH